MRGNPALSGTKLRNSRRNFREAGSAIVIDNDRSSWILRLPFAKEIEIRILSGW